MTNLSPAAQAVLDAVEDDYIHPADRHRIVAAALRAAADQVVPLPRLPYYSCCDIHIAAIRAEFHAIAIELEAQ